MSDIIIFLLMIFLVVCAISWILLESPDLAITEAAVGAGITSVLFFVTLKKIKTIDAMVAKEDLTTPGSETVTGKEETTHE